MTRTSLCSGDKDAPHCRGTVRTLLAASSTLQSSLHPVSRYQFVSSANITMYSNLQNQIHTY